MAGAGAGAVAGAAYVAEAVEEVVSDGRLLHFMTVAFYSIAKRLFIVTNYKTKLMSLLLYTY